MLGPNRFTHIETCAAEVCKYFKLQEDLKDCRTMLSSLDDILADLRSEFTALTGKLPLTKPWTTSLLTIPPNYESLSLPGKLRSSP